MCAPIEKSVQQIKNTTLLQGNMALTSHTGLKKFPDASPFCIMLNCACRGHPKKDNLLLIMKAFKY